MSKTNLMRFSLLVLFCVALVSSHSQMRCAKYNKATGACSAAIRDEGYSFMRESNLYTNGAPICQSPFRNPISSYYANGDGCPDWAPCPNAMGSYTPGESFTVMWFARNHAVADQSPATVSLYLSPVITSSQSADVSAETMKKTLVCSGPYMNCNGKSGNEDPCTLDCKMPSSLASGTYSLWWKWDWQGVMYTTCADVKVTGGSSTPTPTPTTPTPTTPTPTTPTPTTPTPTTPTTPTPTTPTKPSSTTGSPNSGSLCYLPNTPFINAKLGKGGRCGSSSKTRCPDGSCCSKHGYCGTTTDYCTNNQGDYRKYACSTVGDKGIVANQVYEGETEQYLDNENNSNSMTVNFVLIVCSMLLYVTMF